MKPRIVIISAVSFRWRGMVRTGVPMGGILLDRTKPVTMLPISRRLIELIIWGLFSLVMIRGGNRGDPIKVKKMIRAL